MKMGLVEWGGTKFVVDTGDVPVYPRRWGLWAVASGDVCT